MEHGDEVEVIEENETFSLVKFNMEIEDEELVNLEGYVENNHLEFLDEPSDKFNTQEAKDSKADSINEKDQPNDEVDEETDTKISNKDEDNNISEPELDKSDDLTKSKDSQITTFSNRDHPFEFKGAAAKKSTYIRSEPSTQSSAKKIVSIGEILEYSPYNNYWYIVKLEDDVGFIHKKHIHPLVPVEKKELKGIAKNNTTYIRTKPSTKADAAQTVPIGSIIEFNTFSEYWHEVKIDDEVTGYIHVKHVENTISNPKTITGTAQKSPTRIRDRASTKGKTIETLPIGAIIEYKEFSEYWFEINIDGKTGYIHKYHVNPLEYVNTKELVGIAQKSPTNIRENPSTKSNVIKTFPIGSVIEYESFSTYWHKVKVGDQTGYIHKNHIEESIQNQEDHFGITLRTPTNVRERASTQSNVIGTFDKEEIISYRTFSAYWYEVDIVKDGKSRTGYIHKNHLGEIEGKKIKGITKNRSTTIYNKPDKKSNAIKTLSNGEFVEYIIANKDWYYIEDTINGEKITGFIHKNDVENIIMNQTTSWGITSRDTTNIRTKPSVDSKVLTNYPINSIIQYKSFTSLWHEVTVEIEGKKQTGYIHDYHIDNIDDKVFRGVAEKKTTYIRTKPSTSSKPLTTVPIGTVINYKQYNNNWYEAIIIVNDKERSGFIHKKHIEETELEQKHLEGKALRNPTNIRVRPSTEADVLTTFKQGADIGYRTFSTHWYEVTARVNGRTQTGYVHKKHVGHQAFINTKKKYSFSTQAFLDAQMGINPLTDLRNVYVHKDALTEKNGRWVVNGTSWNVRNKPTTSGSKVVGTLDERYTNEPITVHGTSGSFYHISGWVLASKSDTLSYLDPTNFKEGTDAYYQFLVLSDYSGTNAVELNEKILAGKGILDGQGQTFITAAKTHKVNELYLISHAVLETGHGTSGLATGDKYNGKTVYNMYGVGAGSTCKPSPYECGLKRAYEEGWFTPEDAIIGGAKFISEKYVHAGQDTLYKMRWNPDGYVATGRPSHQYATDIGWSVKQTSNLLNYYNLLDSFVAKFEVPEFND